MPAQLRSITAFPSEQSSAKRRAIGMSTTLSYAAVGSSSHGPSSGLFRRKQSQSHTRCPLHVKAICRTRVRE